LTKEQKIDTGNRRDRVDILDAIGSFDLQGADDVSFAAPA